MSTPSFQSFGDEMVKIAFARRVIKGFTNALHEGWHGVGPEDAVTRNSWMGKGRQIVPVPDPKTGLSKVPLGSRVMEEVTSLGGLTKALPVGAKSMLVGTTAAMALQAMHRKDPTGMERSRSERLIGLGANTVGGLAGSAAAMKALKGRGGFVGAIAAPMVGGMLGGHLAEKAVTTPFRAARAARPAYQVQQPPQPQQGIGPDGVPV